jgi:hypothetical protein
MENPLSIILVKSDSKGDRLLFRYVTTIIQTIESKLLTNSSSDIRTYKLRKKTKQIKMTGRRIHTQ